MARKRIHQLELANTVELLDEFIFSRFESQGTRRISFNDLLSNLAQVALPSVADPPANSILALKDSVTSTLSRISSIQVALNQKVDKDGNKVLSTNDFTSAYKSLLDSLVAGTNYAYANATTTKAGLMSDVAAKKVSVIGMQSTISTDNDLYAYIATAARNGLMSKSQASKLVDTYTKSEVDSKIGFNKVSVGSTAAEAVSGSTTLSINATRNLTASINKTERQLTLQGPTDSQLLSATERTIMDGISNTNVKGYFSRLRDSNNVTYSPSKFYSIFKVQGSGTTNVSLSANAASDLITMTVATPSREWEQLPNSPADGTSAVDAPRSTWAAIYVLVRGGVTANQEYYTSFFIPSICRSQAFILTNNYPAGKDLATAGYAAINVGTSTISLNKSYYGGVDTTSSSRIYVYGLRKTLQ